MVARFAIVVLVLSVILPLVGIAGDDRWEPVTAQDWAVKPDSARHYRDAVMLFEKITADDGELVNDKSSFTIYDRIRILTPEGRSVADVVIPYLEDKEKIDEIAARTILPDGKEIALEKVQIHETEVLNSDEVKVKQKSFSLSGVTGDCIIEYQIKYILPGENSVWKIQKDIPLLHGEYVWKFFRFNNSGSQFMNQQYGLIQNAYLTPNFYWANAGSGGKMESIGDPETPEAARFTIENVPAFRQEPNSLSRSCLQAKLFLYYGDASDPAVFWREIAKARQAEIDKFIEDKDRLKAIAAGFSAAATTDEKIRTAYAWINDNLVNVTYATQQKNGKNFDDNESLRDVLKHGYGTSLELNIVFYALLKELKIDAKFAYFVNRDEQLFILSVKNWFQFSGTGVAVGSDPAAYAYYSPGSLYLPAGYMPRYAEGTQALVLTPATAQFPIIPFSSADSNRVTRQYSLHMDPDGKVSGSLTEKWSGQFARYFRIALHDLDSAGQLEKVQSQIQKYFDKVDVDSMGFAGLGSITEPLTFRSHVEFSGLLQQAGARQLFQPYASMASYDNPFKSETRSSSILFDYPYNYKEIMTIDLPAGYQAEGLPRDTSYRNRIGTCKRTCTTFDSTVVLQRYFTLQVSSTTTQGYPEVRQLFGTLEAWDRSSIVLAKKK